MFNKKDKIMNKDELLKFISESDENYYSFKANKNSMSFSQLKNFWSVTGCSAAAFAEYVTGFPENYEKPGIDNFVLGNLGHKIVLEPNKVKQFINDNADTLCLRQEYETVAKLDDDGNEMYTEASGRSKPKLITHKVPKPRRLNQKAGIVQNAAERIKSFEGCQSILEGEKEKALVFEIKGILWRCKVDVINKEKGYITDLKFMQNFNNTWSNFHNRTVRWYNSYFYNLQAAVYAYAFYSNYDKWPTFHILGVSKETPCNVQIITFSPERLEETFMHFVKTIEEIHELKRGEAEPERCNNCHYCRCTIGDNIQIIKEA